MITIFDAIIILMMILFLQTIGHKYSVNQANEPNDDFSKVPIRREEELRGREKIF